jgi:anti-anti-sigma factor
MARNGLRFQVSHTAAGDRIEVSGALTAKSQQRLVDTMWRRAWDGETHITVDLTGLTFFDGTAVMILLGTKRIVERQRGCTVDLCGLEVATRRILALG